MPPLSNLKLYSAGNTISFLNLYISFQIVFSTNQYISYRHLNSFFLKSQEFCMFTKCLYFTYFSHSRVLSVKLPSHSITLHSPSSSFRSLVVLTKVARSHRHFVVFTVIVLFRRSQWPSGLRRGSAAVRKLGLWVPNLPWALMFVCCECCVLSGRGLTVGGNHSSSFPFYI